jgi:formamidopyrimidine-DNA glycosylase
MPELPEVEIVVRNLKSKVEGHKLTGVHLWRKDIRFPIPEKTIKSIIVTDNKVLEIRRRAKFIVIEFAEHFIISHLGMTGSWSVHHGDHGKYAPQKHDHLGLQFNGNLWLIYNDPRRFGFVHALKKNDFAKYFDNYGFEPLEMKAAEIDELYSVAQKSKSPVKTFIMNQKNLVGVGNIYACEALFAAGISPLKETSKIKKESFLRLIEEIKSSLKKAILQGGSSIKNYRNVDLEEGSFQKSHLVYGKENQKCPCCKNLIKRKVQAGRSTFFCSTCQR